MHPTLFDRTPTDPVLYSGTTITSREASKAAGTVNRASGARETQCQRMFAVYQAAGERGVTDQEIHERLGILRYVVPARRKKLATAYQFREDCKRDNCTVFVLVGRKGES